MEIPLRFSLFSKVTNLFKGRDAIIDLWSTTLHNDPSTFLRLGDRMLQKEQECLSNGTHVFIHAYSEIMEAVPQTFKN